MPSKEPPPPVFTESLELERSLAGLLRYGTWLASFVITAGLILASVSSNGMRVIAAGIGLLILLPVSRVVLMLLAFLRDRDYRLALAAALVLSVILAGVILRSRTAAASKADYSLIKEVQRQGRGQSICPVPDSIGQRSECGGLHWFGCPPR